MKSLKKRVWSPSLYRYFELLEGERDPFGLNSTNIKTTASNFKMPLGVCIFLLRETIVSWYRTGAKFGMWLLFSLLFLVSGKKRKTFLLLAPLLHFLLKVSEKKEKEMRWN